MIEPKFDDCRMCRNFRPDREPRICALCTIGEHFLERQAESDPPSIDDLFREYARMTRDDN